MQIPSMRLTTEMAASVLLRLAADNAFFHSVCCRIVAAELAR